MINFDGFSFAQCSEIQRKAIENTDAFNFALKLCKQELKKCYYNEEEIKATEQKVKDTYRKVIDNIIFYDMYCDSVGDEKSKDEDAIVEDVVINAVISACINILDDDRPDIDEFDYEIDGKNSKFSVTFLADDITEMDVHSCFDELLMENGFYKDKNMNLIIPVGSTTVRAGLIYFLLGCCYTKGNESANDIRDQIADIANKIHKEHNKKKEFLESSEAIKRDIIEAFEKVLLQMEKDPFGEETIFKLCRIDTEAECEIEISGLLFHPIGVNVECINDKDAFAHFRTDDLFIGFSVENNEACVQYTTGTEECSIDDFVYFDSMKLTDAAKTAYFTMYVKTKNPDFVPRKGIKYWNAFPYEQQLKLTVASNKEVVYRSLLHIHSIIRHCVSDDSIIEKMKEFGEYNESDWMRILKQTGIVF